MRYKHVDCLIKRLTRNKKRLDLNFVEFHDFLEKKNRS